MTGLFMFANVTCLEMMKIANNNLIDQLSTKNQWIDSLTHMFAFTYLSLACTECAILKAFDGPCSYTEFDYLEWGKIA